MLENSATVFSSSMNPTRRPAFDPLFANFRFCAFKSAFVSVGFIVVVTVNTVSADFDAFDFVDAFLGGALDLLTFDEAVPVFPRGFDAVAFVRLLLSWVEEVPCSRCCARATSAISAMSDFM